MNKSGFDEDGEHAVHQDGDGTSDEAEQWQPGYASEQEALKHSAPFPSWVSPLIYTADSATSATGKGGGMKYEPKIVTAYYSDYGLPIPEFEYRFHPQRKWRLDMAWPKSKVCLECQGGIFIAGRHTRGAALLKEWEKLNNLASMGWRVLYCQPKDVCTIDMCELIGACLK